MTKKNKERYAILRSYEPDNDAYQTILSNTYKTIKKKEKENWYKLFLTATSYVLLGVGTVLISSNMYLAIGIAVIGGLPLLTAMCISDYYTEKLGYTELQYLNSITKKHKEIIKSDAMIVRIENKAYVLKDGKIVSKGFDFNGNVEDCCPQITEYLELLYDGSIELFREYNILCDGEYLKGEYN